MFDRAVRWLIDRQRWIYPLLAAMWVATGLYLGTTPKVALPTEEAQPTAPAPNPMMALSKPKKVVYEASSAGQPLTVSYLDEKGQSKIYRGPTPWQTSLSTSDFGFAAGVTALAQGSITCRILVDGKVEDEKTDTGRDPNVSCNLFAFQKLSP